MTSWRKRIFTLSFCAAAFLGIGYGGLLYSVWNNRTELTIISKALSETRSVTVFGNAHSQSKLAIYSLDGDKHRHGLIPAAHSVFAAWLAGQTTPVFVAVHDQGSRDTDFRPVRVSPADWRPNISGRGPAFDVFLLKELRAEIDKNFGRIGKRYLFGHSLGGFYALDMAARQAQHGFAGIYAFSPTFSHDLSLLKRLDMSCANSKFVYANIGVESGRDTAVFNRAKAAAKATSKCRNKMTFNEHLGIVHALVMLTGQVSAARHIYREDVI